MLELGSVHPRNALQAAHEAARRKPGKSADAEGEPQRQRSQQKGPSQEGRAKQVQAADLRARADFDRHIRV